MSTKEDYNWAKYRYFCKWYGLKGFKAITTSLFRYWLGLKHGEALDVEKTKDYLINKRSKF